MSESIQSITVERVGKFGVQVDGKWMNMDKNTGLKPGDFQDGVKYDVKVNKNESTGKVYIKEIVSASKPPAESKPKEPAKKPFVPRHSAASSNRDFDKEARGKTRCQCWSSVAGAVITHGLALGQDVEEIKQTIREFAEDGYKYTFGE